MSLSKKQILAISTAGVIGLILAILACALDLWGGLRPYQLPPGPVDIARNFKDNADVVARRGLSNCEYFVQSSENKVLWASLDGKFWRYKVSELPTDAEAMSDVLARSKHIVNQERTVLIPIPIAATQDKPLPLVPKRTYTYALKELNEDKSVGQTIGYWVIEIYGGIYQVHKMYYNSAKPLDRLGRDLYIDKPGDFSPKDWGEEKIYSYFVAQWREE